MKRYITGFIFVFVAMAMVGWRLANHPENSAGLRGVSLIPHSEHSHPGPSDALAGIRIRLSPSDFSDEVAASEHDVPQISLAAE